MVARPDTGTDWDAWADDITTAIVTGKLSEQSVLQIAKAAFAIYGPDEQELTERRRSRAEANPVLPNTDPAVPAQIVPGAARLAPLLTRVQAVGPGSSATPTKVVILGSAYWRSDIEGWDVEFPMEKFTRIPGHRSARLCMADARWKIVDLNTKSYTVECVGFSTIYLKTFSSQLPGKTSALKYLASTRMRMRMHYSTLEPFLVPHQ